MGTLIRLHYELLSTRLLLFIASAGQNVSPKPEIHFYLADLYFSLSDEYESRGKRARAARYLEKGNEHAALSSPPDPPPRAAAMAMAVPLPPINTEAIGSFHPPHDVA